MGSEMCIRDRYRVVRCIFARTLCMCADWLRPLHCMQKGNGNQTMVLFQSSYHPTSYRARDHATYLATSTNIRTCFRSSSGFRECDKILLDVFDGLGGGPTNGAAEQNLLRTYDSQHSSLENSEWCPNRAHGARRVISCAAGEFFVSCPHRLVFFKL